MNERIEELKYENNDAGDLIKNHPFFNGPGEFLVKAICKNLLEVSQWNKIFGEFIDPYKRMDYSIRNLPALRVYSDTAEKTSESWFVEGQIKADMILPAVLRRDELQQVQDSLSAALMQQFRRTQFFNSISKAVPGLNELGKTFSVDKSLGFEWEEAMVPLTQIVINFKLDLRVWDDYLEETLRTKDSPFEQVLGSLDMIATTIKGLKADNETVDVEIGMKQPTTGD